MRILFFNEAAAPIGGGRNQYVFDVSARLREAGHEVGLVHARSTKLRFKGTGYVFNHFGEQKRLNEIIQIKLDAILADFAPDIIQIHGLDNMALQAALIEAAPTVRFIHNHVLYCSGGDMTQKLPRRICQRAHAPACLRCHVLNGCGSLNIITNISNYRRVTRILKSLPKLHGIQVASEVILENLVRNGVPQDKITLLPHYASEPAVPRRSNLSPVRRIILHPGGLTKNKGAWMLFHAINKLPDDVELVFVGDGSERPELEAAIRRHNLRERVRIMGELEPAAMSELYHQATLVVFPSRWNEPVGLCGIQAMAHAKPVIAFDAGGVPGWLEDRKNGRLVPFNHQSEFIDVINRLLKRPKLCTKMGAEGLNIWKQKFRPDLHVEQLVNYYRKIILAHARSKEDEAHSVGNKNLLRGNQFQ